MYLIVGLGNPDKIYENTYHNVGFSVLDLLAAKEGVAFDKGECRALTAHLRKNGEKVILAKPITYMNLSGESVAELVRKYKIEREKFLVVYDDTDLERGAVRIRFQGSAGTHNGMKNIVKLMNTSDINRIRVGIGKPTAEQMELKDFVLSKISPECREVMQPAFENAAAAAADFAGGMPIEKVMQKYNKK